MSCSIDPFKSKKKDKHWIPEESLDLIQEAFDNETEIEDDSQKPKENSESLPEERSKDELS